MFGKKKSRIPERISYDPEKKTPVIRCSICSGEQVGGLKDKATGHFEELMLIKDDRDLEIFRQLVGTESIGKEY